MSKRTQRPSISDTTPPDIQILARTDAFSGRLIHLVVDRLRLATGEEVNREVVLHPPAVAILPVLTDGRILLVSQYRHSVRATLWEIPAGLVERGESPLESARRELREETGYETSDLVERFTIFTSPGFTDERITLYEARSLKRVSEPDSHEIDAIRAFSRPDLTSMLDAGGITDAKTILGILSTWQQDR